MLSIESIINCIVIKYNFVYDYIYILHFSVRIRKDVACYKALFTPE